MILSLPGHPLAPRCLSLPEGESDLEGGQGVGVDLECAQVVQRRLALILDMQNTT